MRVSRSLFSRIEQNGTLFRALAVILAALAVWPTAQTKTAEAAIVVGSYLLATVFVWRFAQRLDWPPLKMAITLTDAGFVTLVILFAPTAPYPLWALYVFPLAIAANVDRLTIGFASCLAVAGYSGSAFLNTGTVTVENLWPNAAILATSITTVALGAKSRLERQETRAWQGIAEAARVLEQCGGTDEVARNIVEQTRQLAHADAAVLYWLDECNRLQVAAKTGSVAGEMLSNGTLAPDVARKLDRGAVSVSELGQPFSGSGATGEALTIVRGDTGMATKTAILVALWRDSHREQASPMAQLQVFGPWAGKILAQAVARDTLAESLKMENALRQAASALAGTLDTKTVEETVISSARVALGGAVALVEPALGRVIAGDTAVIEALARMTKDTLDSLDDEATDGESNRDSPSQTWIKPLVIRVIENMAIVVWRSESEADESAVNWLASLAQLAQAALQRCAEHAGVVTEKQQLSAALEEMPVPFALWDTNGRILLANAAYRSAGLNGQYLKESAPTSFREEEVVVGAPPRVFVALTTPIAGEFVASVFREVTREREALRAKDELIAMVGHELRTPLSSIYGYSQMMVRHLGVVEQQVGQLNRLIGDLVDAARLESGNLPLSRERVDLGEVARLAAERFSVSHTNHKLRLELADVPSVEGDPGRLQQVLDNLLSNAAKYSSADEEIVLTLGTQANEVLVSVRDQGIGIPAEHVSHLFERFYRAPSASAEGAKGLGLGLSIVRDIVAAHNGRVWGESAGPSQGSTFWVSLPAAQPESIPESISR